MLPAGLRCNRRRSIPRRWQRRSPPVRAYPLQETAAERVWAAPVPLSRDLPGSAFLGILDDNAHRRQFIADPIGFLEVLSCAGRGAVRNQAIDLLGIDTAGLLLSTIPGRSALRQETEKPQRGGKLLTIPLISGSSTIPQAV